MCWNTTVKKSVTCRSVDFVKYICGFVWAWHILPLIIRYNRRLRNNARNNYADICRCVYQQNDITFPTNRFDLISRWRFSSMWNGTGRGRCHLVTNLSFTAHSVMTGNINRDDNFSREKYTTLAGKRGPLQPLEEATTSFSCVPLWWIYTLSWTTELNGGLWRIQIRGECRNLWIKCKN